MSVPFFSHGRFTFPDTPEARRIADMHTAQQQRRDAARHKLSSIPASVVPATHQVFQSPLVQAASNQNIDLSGPRQLFSDQSSGPIPDPTFVSPDDPDYSADVFAAGVIDSMLSGSAQIIKHSSQDVCNTLISTVRVPAIVADQKKNKAASLPGFLSQVQKLDTQINLPSTGKKPAALRQVMKTAIEQIGSEYKTSQYPIFSSQMVIALLIRMPENLELKTQIHRYLFCKTHEQMAVFGDYCALGKAAPIDIDFNITASHLPGFKILANQPEEWIQFATFILDYACFLSASDLQQVYQTSKLDMTQICVGKFKSVQAYADKELELFNDHSSAAAAAMRSILDPVDRGAIMLLSLTPELKVKIEKRARKGRVPENCQDRDWVVSQLTTLEEIKDPQFTWCRRMQSERPLCRHFAAGDCRFSNCKFSHQQDKPLVGPASPQVPDNNSAALPATQPVGFDDVEAPDAVLVSCRGNLASDCEQNFKTQPAYWESIKDADGKPFSVPKTCPTCRKFRNATNAPRGSQSQAPPDKNTSLAVGIDPFAMSTSVQHEDDGADDFYFAYDLSMSEMSNTNAEK